MDSGLLRRALLAASILASTSLVEAQSWPQWGGPSRDFQAPAGELAGAWPESGPPLLWERPLGEDGYSAILAEAGRLYTMVRRGDDEVVVCLDADTGATVWESAYPAPLAGDMDLEYGLGPDATPALAGDRLFTVGTTVKLHAFDKTSGRILWSHDLVAEMGASNMLRGYGPSPLVFEELVIVTPGGDDQAVAAFRQSDGTLAWKSQTGSPSYSSPILAEIDGEVLLIVALGADRLGLDPRDGTARWRLRLRPESANLMSTQLWDGERHLLFGSAAYSDGSRAVRVEKKNGAWAAEELWLTTRMRVQHGTVVRIGDRVYGSSGDFGPTSLAAIDLGTGEVVFRQRGFSKANLVVADGKLVILDEDGVLALGEPTADGVEIHGRVQAFDAVSWTAPTVVGRRLYARDRTRIKAFDLGKP